MFTSFLSDTDPSLIIVLTYDHAQQCSYFKVLKILNSVEVDECSSNHNFNEFEEKSYSMVEDDAKSNLIQQLKSNLKDEPRIQQSKGFERDNY